MIMQGFYEVWGEGQTWEELQAAVEAFPNSRKAPWCAPDLSWKIVVDSWGQAVSMQEQVELVNRMAYIPFQVGLSTCRVCRQASCTSWSQILLSISRNRVTTQMVFILVCATKLFPCMPLCQVILRLSSMFDIVWGLHA